MCKRLSLILLVFSLPLFLGGLEQQVYAGASDDGWDPNAANALDGFEGIPTTSSTEAKFLVHAGPGNNTIEGPEGQLLLDAITSTTLVLNFRPGDDERIRVALFDPNTQAGAVPNQGIWDQVKDNLILFHIPDVTYSLYAAGMGAGAVNIEEFKEEIFESDPELPDPVVSKRALGAGGFNSDPTSDNRWCSLYDADPADVPAAARMPDGSYRFIFFAKMTGTNPASDTGFDGPERCGYKIAFNGTYFLPKNCLLGFAGGAIDERTILGAENIVQHISLDPLFLLDEEGNSDPDLGLNYDGQFKFFFDSRCTEVVFKETDADYQEPVANPDKALEFEGDNFPCEEGDELPENPAADSLTGLPPDNIQLYKRPGVSIATRRIPKTFLFPDPDDVAEVPQAEYSIRWIAFPTSNPPGLSHAEFVAYGGPKDATPSFTGALQPCRDDGPPPGPGDDFLDGIFRVTEFSQAALDADPGRWCIRWQNVDRANFIWIAFENDFGTEVKGKIKGTVFCDDNENCEFDGFDGGDGRYLPDDLRSVRIRIRAVNNCDDKELIEGVEPIFADSDKDTGMYMADVPLGTWLVDLAPEQPDAGDPPPSIREACDFPKCVEVGEIVDDEVICEPTCDIPLEPCDEDDCKICGRVYCDDDKNGRYTPEPAGDDVPLPGWTVELRKSTTLKTAPADYTTTTDSEGKYCFEVKEFGDYQVSVVWDPNTELNENTKPLPNEDALCVEVECDEENQEILGVDFRFCCLSEICGDVYCRKKGCPPDSRTPIEELGPITPIVGITVKLEHPSLPGGMTTTTTDEEGHYCFKMLLPSGDTPYKITIVPPEPLPPELMMKKGPNPKEYEVELKRRERLDHYNFCYEPVSSIHGKVFKEACKRKCDGKFQDDETCLEGIEVKLTHVSSGRMITRETNDEGRYWFSDLPAGNYVVSIDEQVWIDLDLFPSTPLMVPVTLLEGDQAEVDFGGCPPGYIEGCVWKNKHGYCDHLFEKDKGDEPMPGIVVKLIEGDKVIDETKTDRHGCYKFKVRCGKYRVEIVPPPPGDDYCTLCDPEVWDRHVLPCCTIWINFWFCTQELCGRVWCEPEPKCDGKFDRDNGDRPLGGLEMELHRVSPAEPEVWLTTHTDDKGRYCFERIPTGRFEVRVADTAANAKIIGKCRAKPPTLRRPLVKCGEIKKRQNFYYCEPCEQEICVKVFKEPKDNCDGRFDKEWDKCLSWIQVFVRKAGDNQGYLKFGFTKEDGVVCFKGLEPGHYELYIGAGQERLKNTKPSTEKLCKVWLDPCEKEWCYFGFCETCPKVPCCKGPIRKLCVKTEIWVGEWDERIDLKATFWDRCNRKRAKVIDEAHLKWDDGRFPGSRTGSNGVLTIEDVKVKHGVATVYLCLVADGDWFPHGHFGNVKRRIDVVLNECLHTGCAKFRCETTRVGSKFTWDKYCGPQPPCKEETWDWEPNWGPWDYRCKARFLVVRTMPYESWKACEKPCVAKSKPIDVVCEYHVDCDGKSKDGEHEFWAKLKHDGKVLDEVHFWFDGHHWTGRKTSDKAILKVLKVWCVKGDRWKAKVRIMRKCGCPDDHDWHQPDWAKLWSKIDCAEAKKEKHVDLTCPEHAKH